MKVNSVLAIVLILVMMISVFGWLSQTTPSTPIVVQPVVNDPTAAPTTNQTATQTPNQASQPSGKDVTNIFRNIVTGVTDAVGVTKAPGLIESNQNLTASVWGAVAANAWAYFQPGNGVDRGTGLPKASLDFPDFTDWDLGVYIQAIIDANRTGLIGYDGDWGANARINKVLTFLETRELNATTGYPYWFYQASDGKDFHESSDAATEPANLVDTGRLFVALNNLKAYNSTLTTRINNIVYNRSNYNVFIAGIKADSTVSTSVYSYYVYSGFASFWPNDLAGAPSRILSNLYSAGTVSASGISLPKGTISTEPLLCSLFEITNNDPRLIDLCKKVYLAHEAYYNATGKWIAFSEGNSPSDSFLYEWVVVPNGDTWKVTSAGDYSLSKYLGIDPVIYMKTALGFLAYENTTFARNNVIYLERTLPDPTNGFIDGADNSGNITPGIGSNTNGLILEAARYAIQNPPQ
jgi:hypothetical protein